MINGQKEIWINTGNNAHRQDTVVAFSNCGRIKRFNNVIEFSKPGQQIYYFGKLYLLHRLIATEFIPKTSEDIALNRNTIDHITHHPDNMNINDVRNLRWCTQKENCNFDEAKLNKSLAHKGKKHSEEHKAKIRKSNTNKPKSDFGKKYLEHFGYSELHDVNQYKREHKWYKLHNNKCRWE